MPDPQPQTRPATFQDIIAAEAKKHGVDPRVALAMADTESSFNPAAKSPKGAIGLFQLMPETAKRLGVDPADPIQNIRGGLTEFRRLLDEHGGDVTMALRRYNGSPQAPDEATDPYVQSVLGRLTGQPTGARPSLGRQVGQPPATAGGAQLDEAQPAPRPLPGWKPSAPPVPKAEGLNLGQRAVEVGHGALEMVDPRTRTGRRNIAGGVGAAIGGVAAAGTGGLAAAAIPVLGAATGGLWEELGEQLIGTAPPSTVEAFKAGGQQGAYEVGGQLFTWPIKTAVRRFLAAPIGKAAHAHFREVRTATLGTLEAALDQINSTAGTIKTMAQQTVRYAKRQAAGATRTVRKAGAADVEQATAQGAAGVEAATVPFRSLVAQPPSAAVAGEVAQAAIEGPATTARNMVGKQVEAAAAAAPPVDITVLKAEAQEILDTIAKPQRSFPRGTPEEAVAGPILPGGDAASLARLEQQAAAGGPGAAQARAILAARETVQAQLATAQEAAAQETLKHPALGVIQRILNADDVVPFLDAHLWKSELQNALAGTYDKTVKKQVTSITQKLAGTLRGSLKDPAYDAATANYARIVPLYTKGLARVLKASAIDDPEKVIRLINANKPTSVRFLRDVLVTQSAEGGDAAGGQRAWDLVRSAWTHQKVLGGGIEKLDATLSKLPQEFTDIFYGDPSGQQVLQNMRQIASAYKAAVTQSAEGVARAKAGAAAGVESARAVGVGSKEMAKQEQERVGLQASADARVARKALRVGRRPTTEELRFLESSIAGKQLSPSELAAHGARAFALGPFQIWGGLSWIKLLTGPEEKDLLEWAAFSPANTQRLVKLFTGPSPTGMAIADLLRASGILSETPPKTPSQVGRPPAEVTLRIR